MATLERICVKCLAAIDRPDGDILCREEESGEHEPMPDPTTPAEFSALVERVRAIAQVHMNDPEAHMAEDSIAWAALRAIASGAGEPAKIAATVLATRSIPFCRWFS